MTPDLFDPAISPSGTEPARDADAGPTGDDHDATGIWDPDAIRSRHSRSRAEDMPVPPQWARDAARQAPEHWIYMPDPGWEGEELPPAWAVLGRWRSNACGRIVEWQDNDEYRPSPEALGWPAPVDAVEAALQRTATGYSPQEDLVNALAQVERVAVALDKNGEPRTAVTPDGLTAIIVFSPLLAHGTVDADVPDHRVVSLTEVLALLPDDARRLLYCGLSSPAAVALEADHLVATRQKAWGTTKS
jgi:hypothetical protein